MWVTQNVGKGATQLELRNRDRLKLAFVGLGVIFASLGLGEAVYRLAFFDFDGATDRLPIEMLFGLAFAWIATKAVRKIRQHQLETSAKINLIAGRNQRIRHAVTSLEPIPFPSHQQAIRVIRDEVDRIDWALSEIEAR
jgi:hypothetical protein